jgi:N-acetylmuramoyl-L-alanine amidase
MIRKTLLAFLLLATQPLAAMAAGSGGSAGLVAVVNESDLADDQATVHESGQPYGDSALSPDAGPRQENLAGDDAVGADKPDEGGEEKWIGIVTLTSGNLNVRKGPSLEDEIIGKLPNGAVISVLEQFEEWVSIPYGNEVAYVAKPYVQLEKASTSIGSKVIVLDPGHGGKDPGATLKDGTKEADLVFLFATKAKEALEKAGYVVYLTRTQDRSCKENYKRNEEDLACRAEFASRVGGDIFISIHADSNPVQSFRGTVTFYNARSDYDGRQNPYPEESKRLAQIVQSQVQPAIGSKDRGIDNRNYYVNRMNSVPSVLLELAVLTNANDRKLLMNSKRQDAFARALVKAVDLYFQTEQTGNIAE